MAKLAAVWAWILRRTTVGIVLAALLLISGAVTILAGSTATPSAAARAAERLGRQASDLADRVKRRARAAAADHAPSRPQQRALLIVLGVLFILGAGVHPSLYERGRARPNASSSSGSSGSGASAPERVETPPATERRAAAVAPEAVPEPANSSAGGRIEKESAAPSAEPAARARSFRERQLLYPRVRDAARRQAAALTMLLHEHGITELRGIYVRVFKRERVMEVWARDAGARSFVKVREYRLCAISGRLGPKRRQGDYQIPEGFYQINAFNPWSSYHLSLGISYPNASDRIRNGGTGNLGGDIFVHGGCVTSGCLPITDDSIEELYLLAVRARMAGQRTMPITIFPARLDSAGVRWLRRIYGTDDVNWDFWMNLKEGFGSFARTHRPPRPSVGPRGRYLFTESKPLPEPVAPAESLPAPDISVQFRSVTLDAGAL